MNKSVLTFIFLVFSAGLFAQSPNAFNYQAALRDNQGALLNNQSVGLKIEIENSTGVVYSEESVVQTNAFGIINVQVGLNQSSSSTFADIDWAQGPYSLKTYVDPNGGQSYQFNSSSDILSVPYAKYAERAENLDNGYRLSNFYPIMEGRQTPSAYYFGSQVNNNNGVKYFMEGAAFIRGMPILIESVNGPTFNMQGTSVALRFNHGSGTDFLWGLDGTPKQQPNGYVGYPYYKDSTKLIIYGFQGFYDFDNHRMAPQDGDYDIIINPNLPNEQVLDMKMKIIRYSPNCTICN
jgi:hypothetical protein